MASPSKLCSVCVDILQSGLEGVEKSLHKECTHHVTFSSFKHAVEGGCFICARLWGAISDASIASWEEKPTSWKPFECWAERRPWAPERTFTHAEDGLGTSMLESSAGDIESSTSCDKVHQLAYEWHKDCQETHEICSKLRSSEKFAPSRLIDIGAEGDTWKLCLYPEDIADPPDYFTLSYRWAKNPSIVLLKNNVSEFRQGSPISRLPKTFREAIVVARRFSIRYLWIDSLCIIQDSPEDWATESVRMHQVYTNSSCTISASASEDLEGGLFRSRNVKDVLSAYVTVHFTDREPKKFDIWDEHYIERLTHGPLTRRGWVYQEKILSPGVLHFTGTQIVWECFEMSECEMFPWWSPYPTEAVHTPALKTIHAFFNSDNSGSIFAENEKKIMSVDVYDQWINLIKAYSKCGFTCPDDRLVAMAGIAEMFKNNTGDEYLAGLWKSRLVEGLNWVVLNPIARPQNSFRGTIGAGANLVQIIDASVEYTQASTGRRDIKGSIQLRGYISKATVFKSNRHSAGENVVLKLAEISSQVFAYLDTLATTFEVGEVLHFMPLRSAVRIRASTQWPLTIIEGLMLEIKSEVERTFRRVGQFVVCSSDDLSFFGLIATPLESCAEAMFVKTDEVQKSIVTLE
ncbi:hypothetical protein F53441_3066 [Fusarium austroafricanum]|uniref:Heterokaryon incompatibility domain-containing protein n=1 Tax=Fusarium austroafricanum TaxID=2364996 RepID=A0A8H4NX41_9HYPO|nr:hypothetical protein F53441_3066 [Fusarium austroafricanum]